MSTATDPEAWTRQIFRYIFFSSDPEEQRKKALDSFVARVCPVCPVGCQACKEVKKITDKSGEIPGFDFCVRELDFPHQVTQADAELSYSETIAVIEKTWEARLRQGVSCSLVELSQGADGKDLKELRSGLSQIAGTLSSDVGEIRSSRPSEVYERRKNLPAGLLTFIHPVDEMIGGIEIGTMFVLFGFVGHFKTTAAINMLYNNCVTLGYNMAFLTLEVPKELLSLALLSRHSYNAKFSSVHLPVRADSIRKNLLSDDEEEFLFEIVEPDLYDNPDHGKFYFLENPDFQTLDIPGIEAALAQVSVNDSSPLDGLIVDYLQLFQYLPVPLDVPRNISVGDFFVRQFTELGKKCNGHRMAVILLSQANRKGHEQAEQNSGMYTLQALAEFHELERSASYVLSTFTDPILKESGEVKVTLMKNRFGDTMSEPIITCVDPPYYVFGEEHAGFSQGLQNQSLGSFLDI